MTIIILSPDIHFAAHNNVLTVDRVIKMIENIILTVMINKDIKHMIAPTADVFQFAFMVTETKCSLHI